MSENFTTIHIYYKDSSYAAVCLYLPGYLERSAARKYVLDWESRNLDWDNVERVMDDYCTECLR